MRHKSLALLLIMAALAPAPVYSQQSQQSKPLQPPQIVQGDAIVTGFSGVAVLAGNTRPRDPLDLTFINPDGASARILDIGKPGHVWDGRVIATTPRFEVFARDTGQVFGVAVSDGPQPDIYLAATSAYGLRLAARNSNGQLERRKTGGPGVGWMRGQFGLDLQGGPGALYKIDGRTGAVSLLTNIVLENVPNHGPGLGNIAFDAANRQLFVTDLATGMIHRIALDGRELEIFDHGVAGRTTAQLQPMPFDPRGRASISRETFESEAPQTWGFAPPERRVHAVSVHNNRLYYSVAAGAQIWSVGLAANGGFANDPRWELDVPGPSAAAGVTDIAFSRNGAMIIAERAAPSGSYGFASLVQNAETRVLRFWPKDPNDPAPGLWRQNPANQQPEEYAVGFAGPYRNTNGGVALGYGYDRNGNLAANACEASLWTTAQNIRNAPGLRERLEPGGPLILQGLQGMPSGPVRTSNEPPWTSYSVDFDGKPDSQAVSGHMGSVRIVTAPCNAPLASGGPGVAPGAGSPAVIGDTGAPPPSGGGDCVGRDCNPPCVKPDGTPCEIRDISIKKTYKEFYIPPGGMGYQFTLTVTNNGAAYTVGPGVLTVSDNVPAGMTVLPPTVPGWTCNGPVTGPGVLTCTFNGGLVPAGVITTITLNANVKGEGPWRNCANVGISPVSGYSDSNPDNNQDCVTITRTGSVILKKELIAEFPFLLPPMNFPTIVTCGTATPVSITLPGNGTPVTVTGQPLGASCTAVETPPVTNFCPQGFADTWAVAYLPPSVPVATPANTMIVRNTLTCKRIEGGGITIRKIVKAVAPANVPATMTFPAIVNCGGTVTTLNLLGNGAPQTVTNVPAGASCTVSEGAFVTPPGVCPEPTAGAPSQPTPYWTTTVSPPGTVLAGTPAPVVTITNEVVCGDIKPAGRLIVKKVVVSARPDITPPAITFPINVTCGPSPINLANGASHTLTGAAGTSCSVSEPPPPTAGSSCPASMNAAWTTSYTPSTTAILSTSATPPVITVTNTFYCERGGALNVVKVIDNKTTADVSGVSFPVTANCTQNGTPLAPRTGTVTASTPFYAHHIPIGTICSVTETLPPAPANGCPAGSAPQWSAPVYTPATVTMTAGAGVTVVVKNELTCKTKLRQTLPAPVLPIVTPRRPPDGPRACPPTFIQTRAGECICPRGREEQGGRCVLARPRLICDAPAFPNRAGTACMCPRGTIKRGNSCIIRERPRPRISCEPPARPNARGNACLCPRGMVRRGYTCVSPRERDPRFRPRDDRRGPPGFGFPGRRGDRSGDRGGDRGPRGNFGRR